MSLNKKINLIRYYSTDIQRINKIVRAKFCRFGVAKDFISMCNHKATRYELLFLLSSMFVYKIVFDNEKRWGGHSNFKAIESRDRAIRFINR